MPRKHKSNKKRGPNPKNVEISPEIADIFDKIGHISIKDHTIIRNCIVNQIMIGIKYV